MKGKTIVLAMMLTIFAGLNALGQAAEGAPRDEKHPPRPPRMNFDEWGRGEDIVMFMTNLKKSNPEEFERLNNLRKSNMPAFIDEIRRKMPQRSKNTDKLFHIDRECRELGKKIKQCTDAAEKAKLETELKEKISESFDYIINHARERLEKMQKHLEFLQENKGTVLEERFNDYLNTPPPPPMPPRKPGEPPRP